MGSRSILVAAAGLAVALSLRAGPAGAAPGIDTSGGTVASGLAPERGAVRIEPTPEPGPAPPIPAPELVPVDRSFVDSMPPWDGGSSGADAFDAEVDVTLPAGRYEWSTYRVRPGVTVTYEGAAEIRTAGDVRIEGTVRTVSSTEPAPLVVRAGRDVLVYAALGSPAGFRTQGPPGSDLDIGASRSLFSGGSAGGERCFLEALNGTLLLRAHGRFGLGGIARLADCRLRSSFGPLRIEAATGLLLDGSDAVAGGDAIVRCYAAYLWLTGGSELRAASMSRLDVEAASDILVEDGSTLRADGVGFRLRALDGALRVTGGSQLLTIPGQIDAGARDEVVLEDSSVVSHGTRDVLLGSSEGEVRIGSTRPDAADGIVVAGGAVRVTAPLGVRVTGFARVSNGLGDLRIDTQGEVELADEARVEALLGAVELRAGGGVRSAPTAGEAAVGDVLLGGRVLVASGGAVDLAGGTHRATDGALEVFAQRALRLRGAAEARGLLHVFSRTGAADVAGARIATSPAFGAASGDVIVESYAGLAGSIGAAGATLRSGDSDRRSGDVVLRVLRDTTTQVDAFLAPRSLRLRAARRKRAARLSAAGILDLGTGGPALDAVGELFVGAATIPVPAPEFRGGAWTASGEGVRLRIVPDTLGGSRAGFRLDLSGAAAEAASGAAELSLRYRTASLDAACVVVPERGRYREGGRVGRLVAPVAYPRRVRARPRFDGKYRAVLVLQLAAPPATGGAAPDLALTFAGHTHTLRGGEFRKAGSAFQFRADAPGFTSIRLDPARGLLAARGKLLELDIPQGAAPASVEISIDLAGTGSQTVRVRMPRRFGSVVY